MAEAKLRLRRLEAADVAALTEDTEYQTAMKEENWPRLAEAMIRVMGRSSAAADVEEPGLPHWGGYLTFDDNTGQIVGSCAFKGGPASDGVVEIAYFTYPEFEGRGYATLMARELIELAGQSADVRCIRAHTLPRTSASTRVLEKSGMRFVGDVIDPDDGPVWRWEISPEAGHLLSGLTAG